MHCTILYRAHFGPPLTLTAHSEKQRDHFLKRLKELDMPVLKMTHYEDVAPSGAADEYKSGQETSLTTGPFALQSRRAFCEDKANNMLVSESPALASPCPHLYVDPETHICNNCGDYRP